MDLAQCGMWMIPIMEERGGGGQGGDGGEADGDGDRDRDENRGHGPAQLIVCCDVCQLQANFGRVGASRGE